MRNKLTLKTEAVSDSFAEFWQSPVGSLKNNIDIVVLNYCMF